MEPGQTSPEVQNRGVSGPTKRTDALQIFESKKYNFIMNPTKTDRRVVLFTMLFTNKSANLLSKVTRATTT